VREECRLEMVDEGLCAFLQLVAEGVIIATGFESRCKTDKSIVLVHDCLRSFPVTIMIMV
jgi:hypothetical protein